MSETVKMAVQMAVQQASMAAASGKSILVSVTRVSLRVLLDALAASQAETADWKANAQRENDALVQAQQRIAELEQEREDVRRVRTLDDWHDDDGPVLWWVFHDGHPYEPPYSGTPQDNEWPGYHTHFTRAFVPALGRMLKEGE